MFTRNVFAFWLFLRPGAFDSSACLRPRLPTTAQHSVPGVHGSSRSPIWSERAPRTTKITTSATTKTFTDRPPGDGHASATSSAHSTPGTAHRTRFSCCPPPHNCCCAPHRWHTYAAKSQLYCTHSGRISPARGALTNIHALSPEKQLNKTKHRDSKINHAYEYDRRRGNMTLTWHQQRQQGGRGSAALGGRWATLSACSSSCPSRPWLHLRRRRAPPFLVTTAPSIGKKAANATASET